MKSAKFARHFMYILRIIPTKIWMKHVTALKNGLIMFKEQTRPETFTEIFLNNPSNTKT